MATAHRIDYAALDDEWVVEEEAGVDTSPLSEGHQRLIFNKPFRDGTISAGITVREGKPLDNGWMPREGSIDFRYQDRNNYYFAGVGSHAERFCIGMMAGGRSQRIVADGGGDSIAFGSRFLIQVSCLGNRIKLFDNGVTQLSVLDDTFNTGMNGFHTWTTIFEYKERKVEADLPACFVVMPFASEFDEVYLVIRETVEQHGFKCVRADQQFLSGTIIEGVFEQIEKANLIVADFARKNANVSYEAGYADARNKIVVRIAQSMDDLPFDVKHLRTFTYSTKILCDRKLALDLREAIKANIRFDAIPPHKGDSIN